MRYNVLINVLFISFINKSYSIGISSKLDFGDSSPKIIGTASQYKHPLSLRNEKPKSDFEDLGVVCAFEGCNKTKSSTSSDTIEADVIVHVKTKVEVDKNKTKAVDDIPDVPIVIGTKGFDNSRSDGKSPIVVTNIDNVFARTDSQLPPLFTNFQSQPIIETNGGYIQTDLEPQFDIQIKASPQQQAKEPRYQSNNVELQVPYYEQSYPNHYFGENPSLPQIWQRKSPSILDSNNYKLKAMWKPSVYVYQQPQQHQHVNSDNCPCWNQPKTGIQWQPSRRVYDSNHGVHIDDKLAPLN